MIWNLLLKSCARNTLGREASPSRNIVRRVRSICNHQYYNKHHNHGEWRHGPKLNENLSTFFLTTTAISVLYWKSFKIDALDKTEPHNGTEVVPGLEIKQLPFYSLQEVNKHSNADESVWIVYKAGVYDVTSFVKVHPGGDYVLLAAGNSIEPFWEVYGQHKTQQVYKLLESFRIGNLNEEDRLKPSDIKSGIDALEYIPKRNPNLVKHHEKPFNAETPLNDLVKSFLTPK